MGLMKIGIVSQPLKPPHFDIDSHSPDIDLTPPCNWVLVSIHTPKGTLTHARSGALESCLLDCYTL